MDILSLYNVSSSAIKDASEKTGIAKQRQDREPDRNVFSSMLDQAIDNLATTNSYISDMENEEIKIALGESDNTHDLSIAMQKASTAIAYTVAVRDKFMEAYKEIMQMQV